MPPLPLVCKAVLASTLTGTTPHLEQILQQHGFAQNTPDLRQMAKARLLAGEARGAEAGELHVAPPGEAPAGLAAEAGAATSVNARPQGTAAEGEELRRLAALLEAALLRSPTSGLARACLAIAMLLLAIAGCLGLLTPAALILPAKILRSSLLGTGPRPAALRSLLARAPAGGAESEPGGPPLPTLCPALAGSTTGARLTVPMAPRGAQLWSAEVPLGTACAEDTQLAVAVQWAESNGRLGRAVQVWEQGAEGGRVLASVSSDLEVQLADGVLYGQLRFLGGRRYVLEAAEGGRAVLCLSTDPEVTNIEVGSMPEGVLLATVTRHLGARGDAAAADAPGSADPSSTRSSEHLEILTKPGVDATFVMACTMAVVLFAPPLRAVPLQGRESGRAELQGRVPMLCLA